MAPASPRMSRSANSLKTRKSRRSRKSRKNWKKAMKKSQLRQSLIRAVKQRWFQKTIRKQKVIVKLES